MTIGRSGRWSAGGSFVGFDPARDAGVVFVTDSDRSPDEVGFRLLRSDRFLSRPP